MYTLIIDDHPIVLQGCKRIITAYGACDVVGASTPLEGFRSYRRQRPGMILLDLSFGANAFAGLSFLRRLRSFDQSTPILVFSMYDDPIVVRRALNLGATGFVQKDASPEEIGGAYEAVSQGRPFLSASLATKVAFLNQPSTQAAKGSFSSRELEIIGALAAGHSYQGISESLGISYKTVANICSTLKVKLSAKALPDLVYKCIRLVEAQRSSNRM
ncbi:DNA-binding response regulator [Aureimonas sp. SA4125]|uniref:response regulator transcription factor n=1 Tax=Aureimonas sp. SA4125 TaxID=2826993 RepID=UPI001CC58529|nr:response regulator transcription factor [Aureimonas sp. SA4125]BDA85148.1 DNA-binding response regulator [Aureimonas sp. SA4125]